MEKGYCLAPRKNFPNCQFNYCCCSIVKRWSLEEQIENLGDNTLFDQCAVDSCLYGMGTDLLTPFEWYTPIAEHIQYLIMYYHAFEKLANDQVFTLSCRAVCTVVTWGFFFGKRLTLAFWKIYESLIQVMMTYYLSTKFRSKISGREYVSFLWFWNQ